MNWVAICYWKITNYEKLYFVTLHYFYQHLLSLTVSFRLRPCSAEICQELNKTGCSVKVWRQIISCYPYKAAINRPSSTSFLFFFFVMLPRNWKIKTPLSWRLSGGGKLTECYKVLIPESSIINAKYVPAYKQHHHINNYMFILVIY